MPIILIATLIIRRTHITKCKFLLNHECMNGWTGNQFRIDHMLHTVFIRIVLLNAVVGQPDRVIRVLIWFEQLADGHIDRSLR